MRNDYLMLVGVGFVFFLLLAWTLAPALQAAEVGAAAPSDVFRRCLDEPIQPVVQRPMDAVDEEWRDDEAGIAVALPRGFRVAGRNQGGLLAVLASRSGMFTIAVKQPAEGGSLARRDRAFLDAIVQDRSMQLIHREELTLGGAPAVRYYLQVNIDGRSYCASEVICVHGGRTYHVSVMQKLLTGRCLGDAVVHQFTDGWQWLAKPRGR